jgi:cytochrome c-type biogenesis protein CcmH
MIVLWIAAALMSAACAGLIMRRAALARHAVGQALEDPALAVYRRQLTEVDDLAERGLIGAEDLRSAHAEAARRLLSAADVVRAGWGAQSGGGRVVLAVAVLTPLLALGLYLRIGSPNYADQPYADRVQTWLHADQTTLAPAQAAAAWRFVVAARPNDAEPLIHLAQNEADTGDLMSAEQDLKKALSLAPRRDDLWTDYGLLLTQEAGTDALPDEARQAFLTARRLNPTAAAPLYFLGRDAIARGDVAGGLAMWRDLLARMDPAAPRRQTLESEIAVVDRTHALPLQTPPTQSGDQQAFIRQMVDGLAARLARQPDDPAGWARLVRSYGVLGDTGRRDAALARARALFKDRPGDLAPIEAAAAGARP